MPTATRTDIAWICIATTGSNSPHPERLYPAVTWSIVLPKVGGAVLRTMHIKIVTI